MSLRHSVSTMHTPNKPLRDDKIGGDNNNSVFKH